MKLGKSRDIAILMLPVLAIGAVGWWKSTSGGLEMPRFSNPLDPGPMRIEYSPFKKAKITPLEAYEGYSWKTETSYHFVGKQDLPKTWIETTPSRGMNLGTVRIEFRRGQKWSVMKSGKQLITTGTGTDDSLTFGARLDDVPRDAEEVRLRGRIEGQRYYNGTTPKGWVKPRNVIVVKTPRPGIFFQHTVFVHSKPFDLLIKGPNQPWPKPIVSKKKKVQLRDAKWFSWNDSTGNYQQIFLHLRHQDKNAGQRDYIWWASILTDFKMYDSKNREVFLFYRNGVGPRYYPLQVTLPRQSGFSPALVGTDVVSSLLPEDVAPSNGWGAYKGGLRFEFGLSSRGCWPTKIRLSLRPEPSSEKALRKFGNPANVLGSNGMEP
ncbi:hypothetical protein EON80_10215 [bacterium]|nr:MAG: hypothetical protein EON80_10215 [bacterium]